MTKSKIDLNRKILDLGGKGDERDYYRLNDAFCHTAIFGSTGSGKSTSIAPAIILGLLDSKKVKPEERVGFVVSTYKKGDADIFEEWAYLQGREDDIIRITADSRDVINPLLHYSNSEPMNAVECLMNLSSLIVSGDNSRQEPFWRIEQKKRLHRLVLLNQLSGENLSIATLYQLHVSAPNTVEQMSDEIFTSHSLCWEFLEKAVNRLGNEHVDFRMVEDYFTKEMISHGETDRMIASIKAMAGSVLEPFLSSTLLRNLCTGESKLDINRVFSGGILLLDVPVQIHETAGKLFQATISYILRKAVEQRDMERHGNPLIFMFDEFQVFLDDFSAAYMSTSRSSRSGAIMLTQNISNLHSVLSKSNSEARVLSLLALSNVKIFHANNDPKNTNSYASQCIGKGYRNLGNFSVSQQSGHSAGGRQALQNYVEPHEFSTLRTGGEGINNYEVDAYVVGTGRKFSNGKHFMPVTFKQWFA